jgi:hypothetical protein
MSNQSLGRPLPVQGFHKVSAIVLLSVLLYHLWYTITVKLRK